MSDDLRARLTALADEWEHPAEVYALRKSAAPRLRALLADPAPEATRADVRREVAIQLARGFERKNASDKPDAFMADTWLFAADVALEVLAARPTREEFRESVRSILVDRASLDEHIEEFFDEVLDDIVAAHIASPTLAADLPVATGVTTEDEGCAAGHLEHGACACPTPAPVVSAGDEGVGRLAPEQIETLLCRCDWGKCAMHDEDASDWIEFRRDELIAVLNRTREIGGPQ